jgi:hypothetical protein
MGHKMSNPHYREYTYTLAAGQRVEISGQSGFMTCLSAQADFKVSFGGTPETEFRQGLTYEATPGETMNIVAIRNDAATQNEITVAFGSGSIRDARLSLNAAVQVENVVGEALTVTVLPGATPLNVSPRPPSSRVSYSGYFTYGASAVRVLAANPNRKSYILQSALSGHSLQLHDPNGVGVENQNGPYLRNGEFHEFEHQGEVWVKAAGNATGYILEVEWG